MVLPHILAPNVGLLSEKEDRVAVVWCVIVVFVDCVEEVVKYE